VYGDGVYMNNVTWNTQPNQVKGDRHLILNNTIVNCNTFPIPEEERMNMSIQGYQSMHGIDSNESSLTRNNIANMTHRSWNLDGGSVSAYQIPGVVDHNNKEPGAAYKYLNNPEIYDFRPKKDSPLVDAGKVVQAEEINSPVANFSSISYVGDAPDIGAYEYGDSHYWIPGRREEQATYPIPAHEATQIEAQQDLLFRNAYLSTSTEVYFGTEKQAVTEATSSSEALLTTLAGSANIIKLSDYLVTLEQNTTYYWRVDVITPTGTIKGNIWEFTTSNEETLIIESAQKRLLVYTNPTKDQITISGHQPNTLYTLTDMKGAIISTDYLQQTKESISLAYLPKGIYLLNFPNSNLSTVKVVKY
jgi:hypothetical protein